MKLVIEFGSLSVLAAAVGAVFGGLMNWFLEGRRFRREQKISDLKEKIDRFYSPLLFHFENMRSWATWLGDPTTYAFSGDEMHKKLMDMYEIMRSGMRFASPEVTKLWFQWQPLATMSRSPSLKDEQRKKFTELSEALHNRLNQDFSAIMNDYSEEIGEKNQDP